MCGVLNSEEMKRKSEIMWPLFLTFMSQLVSWSDSMPALDITVQEATAGQNIELKCLLENTDGNFIIWKHEDRVVFVGDIKVKHDDRVYVNPISYGGGWIPPPPAGNRALHPDRAFG